MKCYGNKECTSQEEFGSEICAEKCTQKYKYNKDNREQW